MPFHLLTLMEWKSPIELLIGSTPGSWRKFGSGSSSMCDCAFELVNATEYSYHFENASM